MSYTRKQYMDKEVTHQEYYGQFGQRLVNLVEQAIGRDKILASTDPYFNDIPLKRWDALQPAIMAYPVGAMIAEANGTSGVSLSDCVCAAKAAAHIIRGQAADVGRECDL